MNSDYLFMYLYISMQLRLHFLAVHPRQILGEEQRIQLMGSHPMEVPQHAFLSAADVARKQLQQQQQQRQQLQLQLQQQQVQQQHIHFSW